MGSRPGLERRARGVALTLLAISLSIAAGAGIATWALAETDAFYMNPVDRYGSPAYARQQPVANDFWQAQDGTATPGRPDQAGATSTATSAQPAYRSASGS